MGIFDKIFGKTQPADSTPKKYLNEAEMKQRDEEFKIRFEKTKELFAQSLEIYNSDFCHCSYPRFQQIIGIDCSNTSDSFKCYDTDLLIDLSAKYFNIENSDQSDERKNEKWTCKKCGSSYEYGWSDFSIYVERQKLKLTELKVTAKGLLIEKPIPLYLGLMGHSYPSREEITNVSFIKFEKYMTEK